MGRTLGWGMIALLIGLMGFAPHRALADTESCAQFRQAILDMEAKSVRPPGWLGLDLYLRSLYADQCVLHPTRKARAEYWYRADGTPLGLQAGYTPPGWDPGKLYQPEDGAYTTTPEIAAACAQAPQLTPGMCALMKGLEASCREPVDTQERTQCAAILNGHVTSLPPASEPLPSLADLLGPLQPGAPPSSNAAIAADPGFQRMCGQARDNYNACTVRRQNMTSLGTTNQGGSGQAGAFYECQQLYDGVLRMCGAVTSQRMPRMAIVAPTKSVPPGSAPKPAPTTAASSPPPSPKPASGAAGCPAGMKPTGDGYCVSADQNYCGGGMSCAGGMICGDSHINERRGRCHFANGCYPDQTASGAGCMPSDAVNCGGAYCPAGSYCRPGGGCGGVSPGPICPGGGQAPAGTVCSPYGGVYDARHQKLCGTKICDIRDECGNNACLSPFHQTAATPQRSGR